MKRDWSIIRQILEAIEAHEYTGDWVQLNSLVHIDGAVAVYHLTLLEERNLIIGRNRGLVGADPGLSTFHVERMTWEGHDLLDTMRSQGLWNRITDKSKELGVELTLDSIHRLKDLAWTTLMTTGS